MLRYIYKLTANERCLGYLVTDICTNYALSEPFKFFVFLVVAAAHSGLFTELPINRKRRKRTILNKSKLTTRWNRWIIMESCRIVQGVGLDDLFSSQAIFRSSNSIVLIFLAPVLFIPC